MVVPEMPGPDVPSRKDQWSQLEAMLVLASHQLSAPSETASVCWKCLTHVHILPTQALPFPPSLKGCHWAAIKAWLLLFKLASFVSLLQVLMIPNKFPVPQTPSPKLLSKESNLWQLSSLLWVRNKSRVSYCLGRLSGGQDDRGEKGSALNELDPLTLTGR